jgi:hypothetical protein
MILTSEMKNAAKLAWHNAAMKKADFVKILDPDGRSSTDRGTRCQSTTYVRRIVEIRRQVNYLIGDHFGYEENKNDTRMQVRKTKVRKVLGIARRRDSYTLPMVRKLYLERSRLTSYSFSNRTRKNSNSLGMV